MRDVSKDLWYIHRTIIKILNDFQEKSFYTTGAVREKYDLDSYTRLLPRLEKMGPDWAYLQYQASYTAPKDLTPDKYIIIYELLMNKNFPMDPRVHEPEHHPYIVIKDNTQFVEIKLFQLINGQPTILRDYDREMRF